MPVETDTDSQGNVYVRDGTQWRPASEQEKVALEMTSFDTFKAQAIRGAADMFDYANMALSGMHLQKDTSAMGRLSQREGTFGALDRVRPDMSLLGREAGGFVAGLPLELGAASSAPLRSAFSRQAAEELAAEGVNPENLAGWARQAADASAAGDSVGSMSIIDRLPIPQSWRETTSKILDEFIQPQDLTDQQMALMDTAKRLDFEFLPGQVRGSKMLGQSVMSDPVLREAFEDILSRNRDRIQGAIVKGLGLPEGTPFTDDMLGEASRRLGSVFEDVAESIGTVELPENILTEAAELGLSTRRLRGMDGPIDGERLMQLRTSLNQQRETFMQPGKTDFNAAEDVTEVIKEIDSLIAKSLDGSDMMVKWREAQQRWRFLTVLEKSGVINHQGEVVIRTAANKLKANYKREFKRSLNGGEALPDGIGEAFDYIKVAAAFADNVGDSGTATRMGVQNMISDPAGYGKRVFMRHMLERHFNN